MLTMSLRRLIGIAPLLLFVAACSSPANPSPDTLTITCPETKQVQSDDGISAVVTFFPSVSGGIAPVLAECTPPSGSRLPIGTTQVTCTAQDSRRRSSVCLFNVRVTSPPRLSQTRFVAFGGSSP